MRHLYMPIDDINKQMKFNCCGYWDNYLSTHCYAYALGIHIPEDRITINAYQPGTIGSIIFNIKLEKIHKMSLEEKIYLDLTALNISYSECSQSEISCIKFDNDYITYQWIIALFTGIDDFHFMRKNWDNIWWHKLGYSLQKPINYDDNFETILNPLECTIDDYKYLKCLKLTYKEK